MEFFNVDCETELLAAIFFTKRKDAKKMAKQVGGKVVKSGKGKNKAFGIKKDGTWY